MSLYPKCAGNTRSCEVRATGQQRDGSLDALRGGDVILMILVNLQGSDDAALALLKHAPWNGLTFADLVFPIFLLVTGLSVPLALDRPGAAIDWRKLVRRTLLLFAIGVVLGWLIKPSLDPAMIRWAGVLQRIAVVYFLCAIVAAVRRGPWLAALLAILLLSIHAAVLLLVAAPGEAAPTLAQGAGISAWLDQQFLPGRVHRVTWDPEGILSTVSAIANGLIGVATMRWITLRRPPGAVLIVLALALIGAGLVLTHVLPLNKGLWTPSFALVTSGAGLLVWALLRAVWLVIGDKQIMLWLVSIGRAALTVYVVHMLLIALIVRRLPDGTSVWEWLFEKVAHWCQPPALAALVFAVLATAATLALIPPLRRRGWILRV